MKISNLSPSPSTIADATVILNPYSMSWQRISILSPPPSTTINATVIFIRIYCIMVEDLDYMQLPATNNGTAKCSKLESFSTFLWNMVARAASIDKNGRRDIARMGPWWI
ncbi:hypothetical protein Lalb_Chr22g0359251 [Lupinus albus]|uniref:Uncharacterized protein n=1 Tax=Lupinus albus TaxID=3870 RepID=A0A6A4NML0_LUPAL|nr:hypothetical protein Lalb_Chr22g0359251 [Lupinus albus]